MLEEVVELAPFLHKNTFKLFGVLKDISTAIFKYKRSYNPEDRLHYLVSAYDFIKKGYNFLQTVHVGAKKSSKAKKIALGDFIAEIRKDMLSGKIIETTSLIGIDFKILKAN